MSRIRAVLAMAHVDLLRMVRDRTSLFFALVLPVLIIMVIGAANPGRTLVLGVAGTGSGAGATAQELREHLAGQDVDIRDYDDAAALRRDVRRNRLTGGMVVSDTYTEDLAAGRTGQVDLVVDPTSQDAAQVRTRIGAAVSQQAARVDAARMLAAASGMPVGDALAAVAAVEPSVATVPVEVVRSGSGGLGDLAVFDYALAGQLLLFLFLTQLTSGGDLVLAKRLGIVGRMLASPMGPRQVLLGAGAPRLVLGLVQTVLLVGLGITVFQVGFGNLVAVALILALFLLASSGAGLLVGAIARTPEQATSLGPPLGIALAMIGGCLWPLEIVPRAMQIVARATPHAWAMDAFIDVMGDGAGPADIVAPLGVLALFAAGLLTVGAWRLRRSMAH
jgi:ABC-2 type transport system permease protein